MATDGQTYAFDNARAVQRDRLDTLETLFDPGTIRQLEARGVAPGWRCFEVGAGGGSIAAWLCDRVGPEGTVLATDLDTKWVSELAQANLEVRVHDLLDDDLPDGEFDSTAAASPATSRTPASPTSAPKAAPRCGAAAAPAAASGGCRSTSSATRSSPSTSCHPPSSKPPSPSATTPA
jgi:hypothetical protein